MPEDTRLTEQFEQHRNHLRSVAYRMLGSLGEADDAVQEAWIRSQPDGSDEIANLGGWLTTVVARVCLNVLRSRVAHPESPFDVHMPEPIVDPEGGMDPEHEAVLADSVGLALQVVLEMLAPPERLAFVLHDMFSVPFDEIAAIMERSPASVRQLASRGRRRVQGTVTTPDASLSDQRVAVDAFFAASREGNFEALVAVLDPDVVLRSDGGTLRPGATIIMHGAEAVARNAVMYHRLAPYVRTALVNGAAGVIVTPPRGPFSILGFTVVRGKIVAIDVLADPGRLRKMDLAPFQK